MLKNCSIVVNYMSEAQRLIKAVGMLALHDLGGGRGDDPAYVDWSIDESLRNWLIEFRNVVDQYGDEDNYIHIYRMDELDLLLADLGDHGAGLVADSAEYFRKADAYFLYNGRKDRLESLTFDEAASQLFHNMIEFAALIAKIKLGRLSVGECSSLTDRLNLLCCDLSPALFHALMRYYKD